MSATLFCHTTYTTSGLQSRNVNDILHGRLKSVQVVVIDVTNVAMRVSDSLSVYPRSQRNMMPHVYVLK